MSQNCPEEISVKKIFDLLSSYFKDTYDVLLNVLHEEPNYKRLLKIGEKQFFDAPNESSIEEESQKSRLCFAKTNLLAVEVDNDIDRIIEEKFQGEFLDKLKDEVLKAILQLSAEQISNSEIVYQDPAFQFKPVEDEEKSVSPHVKNLRNSTAHKTCNTKETTASKVTAAIRKVTATASKETNGQAELCLELKLDKVNNDPDLSMISFDSVSSVHTSDLSSYEDEISLSSDEESGAKSRRLSVKEVQEKLEKCKSEIMESAEEDEDYQPKNNRAEGAQIDPPLNNSESCSTSQKSQRRRKPNFKYTDDDIISPFKRKSVENISTASPSVNTNVPRKRGRPRKHSILS